MSDIGVWQTTTQIEQESSDPSVTAEDKARDTLDALDEIPTLTQELANDASRYDLHTKLIELLERADMPDQLEFARQQMHKIYPLPESMWLNWLQDAKKRGDEDGLKQLYEEANKDYLSIPIWKDFVDYTLEKFYAKWGEDGILVEKEEDVVDLIESTRNDLLKAVKATRNHVAQSHEIWNPYADFERQILEKFKKPEQFEKLKELYNERLEIVHIACEETFSKYSNLISSWDNANYEDNMVQSNKIYAATKEAAEERDYYERKLVDSGYAMDAFYEYIEYEKNSQKKPSLNYVQNLYERAIAIYCTDVILWNDYICFLLEKVRVFPILETIILRALRNCPWSGLLWGHLVRVMELENRSKEQILEIFERALSNATLRSSLEDLVSLFLAKCDYLRNNTDWEDQNSIADLRVAFEEAMLFIDESFPETGDPYFRIEKRYAFVEGYRLKNFAKSTELWEKIVKRYGQSTFAWLEYIQFERMMGRTNICRGLFRRGLPKNIDQPQKFIDAYMAFEHELGTADTIADMLVRVSKKNRILAAQWQEAQGAEAMEAAAVAYYEAPKSRPAKEKRKRGPRSAAAGRKQRQRYPKQDNQERFEQRYSVESSQEEDAEAKQTIEEKDTEPQQTIEEGKDVETEANIPAPEVSVDTADQPAAKKRKASVAELSEGDTEDMSEGSAKRPRTMNEERGRGRTRGLGRGPRQRGRSRKAISLARPTSRQQPQQQSSSSQQSEQEEVAPAPAAPKSNQDFRAMLLGKK